jgi:predicted O-methyltransferase YrrM
MIDSQSPSDVWNAVERYITDSLIPADSDLDNALASSEKAGLPPIQVSANTGKLLHLIARSIGARRILEIGTLGGYSTIWLGRALPADGRLVSLELVQRHAELARTNIARAGLSKVVEVRTGAALDTLPQLGKDGLRPFDFIFIDADKANIPAYFDWSLKLSRKGSIIVVDNVVREGAVTNEHSDDPAVRGVRRLNEMIAAESRVTATTIQTVGSKGYDGFTLALVTG